jgi:hypothetical protein
MRYLKMMLFEKMVQVRELVYSCPMRTSVTLDDDVHEFAASYAHGRGITLSAALNELVRKAEAAPTPVPEHFEFERSPNGLPLLPRTGRTITSEMVKQLEEEEFDPKKFA